MEKTKKPRAKSSAASPEKIKSAFLDYLLTNGAKPPSVYKFCLDLGIKEDEFYSSYGSFDGVEKSIWKGFADETINRLKSDQSFASFSIREKILAFYYTLFEILKANRSFILLELSSHRRLELVPEFIKGFKASYENFVETLLNEGKSRGEIAARPFLDKGYPKLFWLHMGFLLIFWKEDESPDFEKTDAAIEKSVNLAFDLIERGAVDSAIDFAKFMYQSKRN